jgi:hypothetical protein
MRLHLWATPYIVADSATTGKTMDLTRWKSILVPREMYLEVREMAAQQGRTISGQLRIMHDSYKIRTKWRPSKADEPAEG